MRLDKGSTRPRACAAPRYRSHVALDTLAAAFLDGPLENYLLGAHQLASVRDMVMASKRSASLQGRAADDEDEQRR
eukprot:CAMPEP_0182859610 /NCGR_PEP_ID=MMETSP0034_2-20130328/4408_1 /TAXON_ID=156128 /ORGANISM="Nephroselmis pyriformis, Strain CCMP717" /LENGTH=75 /DNA_ID=CAMNT_0024991255 /DNA_START=160 /DNA_END=388 /DNA_ORIENTATION=-